jgi:hypothetical protein
MKETKKHAPKEVFESWRGDHRCGVCGKPVDRFSAPRAVWVHRAERVD